MYNNTHFMEMTKVISEPVAFKHTIFLDECIDNTSYYRSAIATLKSASESDIISMVFDTEGGLCHTASVFESAMRECKAHIKGELCGQVASAGTKLALACDDWVVGDDVVFMCHTASYGASNSAEKLRDQVEFLDKWVTKMNTDTYTGFLTEDELSKMNDSGKEYWFGAEELISRLQNFAEHRQKQQEAAIEDVISLQTEQSSEMEKVLHKQLVESKQFSQEEIDLARRINEATFALDESLSDEEFSELMEAGIPPESLDDEPEDRQLFPVLTHLDTAGSYWAIHKNKEGNIFLENEPLEDVVKNCGIEKLCKLFQVKLPHNIKSEEKMIDRLKERLNQLLVENFG